MPEIRPIGVLLAAGRGRRMGGRKQFFPWRTAEGEKPLVCASFDAIAPVCRAMVVVLGHLAEEVAAVLGEREFQAVLSDPDAPMFESIRVGLRAALEIDSEAAVLLQPGDHPEVSAATLETILAAGGSHADQAIIPEFDGRGGHPVLIPSVVARQILPADCPKGLGQFWAEHIDACVRLAVEDAYTLRDVDSAE